MITNVTIEEDGEIWRVIEASSFEDAKHAIFSAKCRKSSSCKYSETTNDVRTKYAEVKREGKTP